MEYSNIDIRMYDIKSLLLTPGFSKHVAMLSSHENPSQHVKSEFFYPQREWDALESALAATGYRTGMLFDRSEVNQPAQDMGEALFRALFDTDPDVRDFYRDFIRECADQQKAVRLRLHIDSDKLKQLPWELMYDYRRGIRKYLCFVSNPRISIVRIPLTATRDRSQTVQNALPLRVLGMTAQPKDRGPLPFASVEQCNIQSALQKVPHVKNKWITHVRVEDLRQEMKSNTWHILHFIGHGGYDPKYQEGYISLENEDGNEHPLRASQLRTLLPPHNNLRLVVLNSCEGAKGNTQNELSSVAASLAADNVPAVLAMQYKVYDEIASLFAEEFYTQLTSEDVEKALFEARCRIHSSRQDATPLDWAMPALYQNIPEIYIARRGGIRKKWWLVASIMLIVCILLGGLLAPWSYSPLHVCASQISSYNPGPDALDFIVPSVDRHAPWTQCSDLLGLSSGSFVFDHWSAAYPDLEQAAQAHDTADKDTAFTNAINADAQNAEARIYQEDQNVLASHGNYIIAILGVAFQSDGLGGMRDILQGAYIAQIQYNQQAINTGQPQVVVLIANAGGDAKDVTSVAQGIVSFAQQYNNVIGVMGWPLSAYALNARDELTQHDMLMVSSTASSNDLTGRNPLFFRVASSDLSQANVATQYISQQLHSKNVAVFYDQSNNYTTDLGTHVHNQLNGLSVKNDLIGYNNSQNGQTLDDAFSTVLHARNQYDLIYLASYVSDAANLLTSMQNQHAPATLKVMGGDALAVLNNYPANQPGLDRLIVTAFTAQDEWNFENHESDSAWTNFVHGPNGVNGYIPIFSPGNNQTRIDSDVMLAYDAMNVLLQGYQKAAKSSDCPALACRVASALTKLTWQGVSGQISFSTTNGDPLNRAIVVAHVAGGQLHTDKMQGCFFVTDTPPCAQN